MAFVNGVAEFTRLRVDRPGSNLTLQFSTNPTRFQTVTSIKFTVVAPPTNTPHKRLRFSVLGSVSGDLQAVQSSIRTGLASALDVDISRITDVTYAVSKYTRRMLVIVAASRACKITIFYQKVKGQKS